MIITRHEIKNPQIAAMSRDAFYRRATVEGIPVLRSEPYNLGRNSGTLIEYAAITSVLGSPKSEPLKDLRYALLLSEAHWMRAGNPEAKVSVTVEGHVHEIPSKPIKNFVRLTNWVFAGYLALVLRDKNALQNILHGGIAFFHKDFESLTIVEKVRGRFYHAIFEKDSNLALKKLEDYELENEGDAKDFLELIKNPQIGLWKAILHNDNSAAVTSLTFSLECHKKFWGTEKNRQDKNGWISLPLLAACAYAYDHGMDLNVESDYIPRWIVTGDFA
jgi:hypothetical protein